MHMIIKAERRVAAVMPCGPVQVTFSVSAAGKFSAAARDLESGDCYTWQP